MIRKEIKRHKTIQTKSPRDFDLSLEKLMEEIALDDPVVERFFDASIGHCAYVEWTVSVLKPEDVRDEFELQGIQYLCGECPFYEMNPDKRVLYSVCKLGQKTKYGNKACVQLYEMIQKGDVNMEVQNDTGQVD